MNVYCYFELLDTIALPVLEAWKDSWSNQGWTPVVLSEEHFFEFNRAKEFNSAVSKLPTINDPAYERACYRRWAAMAAIGGGLMTDYDVVNVGYKTSIPPTNYICRMLDANSPCAVYCSGAGFETACDIFMGYKIQDECYHTSDMHITNELREKRHFYFRGGCVEYLNEGWEESPLVHVPYAKAGTKKAEIMREIIEK